MKEENMIRREEYMSQITRNLGMERIIVLTGQRRVGKSCLLRMLKHDKEENPNNNVIFIDKEKFEFDEINDYRQLNQYIAQHHDPKRPNYIFIDEVQDIKEFEKSLRSWYTEDNTDVVVTGSNAYMLNSQLTTLIGGRYKEIYVQPLSYIEFIQFHSLSDSDDSLIKFLDYGGMPGLQRIGLEQEAARQYQIDVYNTALLKDVIQRNEIRNVNLLQRLSRFIADNIGKPISALSISKYLKAQGETITSTVVGNYLTYLSSAFIMRQVPRFDIHGKKLLDTNGKFYFEDTGIRNAIVGGTRQGDIEKLMENVVYQELRRQGYIVEVGQLRAGEVDFVCSHPTTDSRLYIQVAYLIATQETYDREFGTLRRIDDNYPKYVISMSPLIDKVDDQGIKHLHLRHFLNHPIV